MADPRLDDVESGPNEIRPKITEAVSAHIKALREGRRIDPNFGIQIPSGHLERPFLQAVAAINELKRLGISESERSTLIIQTQIDELTGYIDNAMHEKSGESEDGEKEAHILDLREQKRALEVQLEALKNRSAGSPGK